MRFVLITTSVLLLDGRGTDAYLQYFRYGASLNTELESNVLLTNARIVFCQQTDLLAFNVPQLILCMLLLGTFVLLR